MNTEPAVFWDSDFGLPADRRSEAVWEPEIVETPLEKNSRRALWCIVAIGLFTIAGLHFGWFPQGPSHHAVSPPSSAGLSNTVGAVAPSTLGEKQ